MAKPKVVYFVKFCTQQSHADDFIAGKLYMNRLRYFRQLEAAEGQDDGRPDATEAVGWWWQPHDIEITLNIPTIGEIKITKDDLAGPVSGTFTFYDDLHLFCLSTVAIDLETEGQNEADCRAKVKAQLQINERCLSFGPYAVVVQAPPFMARVKQVLQQRGQWFKGARVEYYDEETFHGSFAPSEAPFKKQKRFYYQDEFRICVQSGTQGDDPIVIDVGDLSGFSARIDSAKLNVTFNEAQLAWTARARACVRLSGRDARSVEGQRSDPAGSGSDDK